MYKIYNLPLPSNGINSNQTDVLLQYELEAEMLIVSKDKTVFLLMSDEMYRMCINHHYQFYHPETAFYQTKINKLCIMALFMDNTHDIKTLCKLKVVFKTFNHKTFNSRHLDCNHTKLLTLIVSCRMNELKTNDIKIKAPFGHIKLTNTCKAMNKYL